MHRHYISDHFTTEELECPCCGQCDISGALLDLAESVRHQLGDVPMIVHSGFRCVNHNLAVGGSPRSKHLYGRALDFHVKDENYFSHKEIFSFLLSLQEEGKLPLLGGLGLYSWGIHIDTDRDRCGRLRVWRF